MAEHPDILLFQKCKKFGKDVVEELLATASPEVIQDWEHALNYTKTFYDVDHFSILNSPALVYDVDSFISMSECMIFQYRAMMKRSNNLTEAQRSTLNMIIQIQTSTILLIEEFDKKSSVGVDK